jgi:hypothetical protein
MAFGYSFHSTPKACTDNILIDEKIADVDRITKSMVIHSMPV